MSVVTCVPVLLVLVLTHANGHPTNIADNFVQNETRYYHVVPTTTTDPAYPRSDTTYPFLLFRSTNLKSWRPIRFLFNGSTQPDWEVKTTFIDPNLVVIGSTSPRVYYSAKNSRTNYWNIGVGLSANLEASFMASPTPLLSNQNTNFTGPSVLLPSASNGLHAPLMIFAVSTASCSFIVPLTPDGLRTDGDDVLVLEASLDWERGVISKAWLTHRDQYFYIFYTGKDGVSMGVARSQQALGPYEKQTKPIAAIGKTVLAWHNLQSNLMWGQDGWPSLSQ